MLRKDLPFIDVYFPAPGGEKQKARWQEREKLEGQSRAAFIWEAVEAYMADRQPRLDFKLHEKNWTLCEQLELRALAIEMAETDLFRMQNATFPGVP